jgi:hypothetical protein
MKPPRLDSDMFHETLQDDKLALGIVITFQVMAVAGVSPGDPYPVRAVSKRRQDKLRADPSRTRDPYHPDIGRILHAADTCKVGRPIAAPVAQKSNNPGFPIRHCTSVLVTYRPSPK